MSAMSNYLEGKLVEHVLRNVAYTSPTTVYVALYTSDPGEANSGTEVSGGSYARTAVTFGAHSNGAVTNSGVVTFPTCTVAWGVVTHFAIFDDPTAGNELVYGALTASKTVGIGDVVSFQASTLTITFA